MFCLISAFSIFHHVFSQYEALVPSSSWSVFGSEDRYTESLDVSLLCAGWHDTVACTDSHTADTCNAFLKPFPQALFGCQYP